MAPVCRPGPRPTRPHAVRGQRLRRHDPLRDPSVGAEYRVDPLAHHRTTVGLGREALLAQPRALADLGSLRVQTLVIHGGADPLVPVESSAILATLPGVDRKVYPDLRHETLNEPEGPQVAADIAVWIGAQLASSSPRA